MKTTLTTDDCKECFAIRGKTMVDLINPHTGLSWFANETLDQICARYPGAERMTVEDYCASKAAAQDTPIAWEPVTAEDYDRGLGELPPALMTDAGFLLGEPTDHHAGNGRPRFQAYLRRGGQYFASNRPLTAQEFKACAA